MRNVLVLLSWVSISLGFLACSEQPPYVSQEEETEIVASVVPMADSSNVQLDSVEQILSQLKTSEAQAAEFSLTMSSMIAQTGRELPTNLDNQLYMTIENVPRSLLPQQSKKLVVGGKSESSTQAIFSLSGTGNLDSITSLPKDFVYNPYKKTQAYFENGKIFICSEQPYKATVICGVFRLENKKLIFEESTYQDLSAEAIAKAYKALENNQLIEAVNYFEQVQYPQHYMQVEEEVIKMLQKAYPIVLDLEKKKHYEQATEILERIFDFWGADFLHKLEKQQDVDRLFVSSNFDMSSQMYLSILKKYGELLIQTKKYLKAVQINTQLTKLQPTYAPAYLQLGDAYYGLEQLEESKIAYQQYKTLKPQQDTVQERALKRLKKR